MRRITDKSFIYTSSFETDIGARFKRMAKEKKAAEKAEQERLAAEAAQAAADAAQVVRPIKRGKP